VDITLLTTFNLVKPAALAILKGISKSIVSPDYETDRKPPFLISRSLSIISEAILASIY